MHWLQKSLKFLKRKFQLLLTKFQKRLAKDDIQDIVVVIFEDGVTTCVGTITPKVVLVDLTVTQPKVRRPIEAQNCGTYYSRVELVEHIMDLAAERTQFNPQLIEQLVKVLCPE